MTRLREDREAGVRDRRSADAERFRAEYKRLGQESDALNAEPGSAAGMVWVPTESRLTRGARRRG